MPSAVADPLFYRLLDAFPPNRAYTPAAFEREPMAPPVAHFLKHWLEHRVRHEATHLQWPHSAWFDEDHTAVQEARQAFIDTLTKHGRFPATTWETSLREAVQQATAYLVRPVTTLETFVFRENSETIAAEVMDWRLGYFKDYGYFHEAMRLFVEQRQVQTVKRAHFTDLLRKVDHKITKNYGTDAWLRLLAPLFDLIRRAGAVRGTPIALLQAFFKEKEADDVLRQLRLFQQHRGLDTLDEEGLRRLLDATQEPIPVPPSTPHHSAPIASSSSVAEPTGPVPRWKQFQQGQVTPPPTPPPARRSFPKTPDQVRPGPSTQEAVPRWMQFRAEPTADPEPPTAAPRPVSRDLAALEQAVLGDSGALNRDVFVNNLFTQSIEAYQRVLQNLYGVASWAEASKIIAEEVFRKHQVDIYSDPAVLFTDAVEARYAKRDA